VNKLALATSISALIALASPLTVLAADSSGGALFARDSSISIERDTDLRLLFLNEKLYPDTLTLAPIDDENATLAYAFSSDVTSAEASAWCAAVCDVNPNLYHYSAAQDDGTGGGIDQILCDETVCWIQ
jgi:hypothetical protein